MDLNGSGPQGLAGQEQRKHIEQLLQRYPDVGADEAAAILRFLKKGLPVEVGLLSSNEAIRPQLERFRRDHHREFSLGWKGLAAAVAIIAFFALTCVLLWDAGTGR